MKLHNIASLLFIASILACSGSGNGGGSGGSGGTSQSSSSSTASSSGAGGTGGTSGSTGGAGQGGASQGGASQGGASQGGAGQGGGAALGQPCGQSANGAMCAQGLVCCYPCGIPNCNYLCTTPCDPNTPGCVDGCMLVP